MRSGRQTERLFFALLPEPDTAQAIAYHADQLSPVHGRKVKRENLHITLLFLGNVDHAVKDRLCSDCDELTFPTFDIEIDRAGWWKKAGILWLGPKTLPATLKALHDYLLAIACQCRLAVENRPYAPHITLMRKVSQAPPQPVVNPFTWHVKDFSLMQSITHPVGVEYRELMSWSLLP